MSSHFEENVRSNFERFDHAEKRRKGLVQLLSSEKPQPPRAKHSEIWNPEAGVVSLG